jgi:hypothetical protein
MIRPSTTRGLSLLARLSHNESADATATASDASLGTALETPAQSNTRKTTACAGLAISRTPLLERPCGDSRLSRDPCPGTDRAPQGYGARRRRLPWLRRHPFLAGPCLPERRAGSGCSPAGIRQCTARSRTLAGEPWGVAGLALRPWGGDDVRPRHAGRPSMTLRRFSPESMAMRNGGTLWPGVDGSLRPHLQARFFGDFRDTR